MRFLRYLQPVPVYVKIYPDEIEITDLRDGNTIRRTAIEKFSSVRLLLADFYPAETLVRNIVEELGIKRNTTKMAIQYMVDLGGGIANTELLHLRNLGEFTGAAFICIILHNRKLTNFEVLQLIEKPELWPPDVTS